MSTKFKNKSAGDILDMMREKEKGFLLEEEWKSIICYIYDSEDSAFLEGKIVEFIRKRLEGVSNPQQFTTKRLTREELASLSKVKDDLKILYKEFTKIVMDYQIKLRDRYLNKLVCIFKKIDQDNNGIIQEDEFYGLLSGLGYYNPEIDYHGERLLSKADPYNNKQLTFSEIVYLFAEEIFVDQDENGNEIHTTLLDKISTDENILQNFS